MMISDDERREVAARLRERESVWRKNKAHVNVVPGIPSTQYEDMAALLGFSGWTLGADVFARLADLIEPQDRTCVVAEVWEGEYGLYYTLSCGHTLMTDEPDGPSYCLDCGAKVVSDDD